MLMGTRTLATLFSQVRVIRRSQQQKGKEGGKRLVYLLTACGEACLQVMEDTDRCGRGGGDGGWAAVSAGRLAVRLCGRVQGHGVLGDPALAGVVLRGERVRRCKLCGDAVLWGGRVLGWGVRLGHRFRGVAGLLVTLETQKQKFAQRCERVREAVAAASLLRLEESLIIANEHSLRGDTGGVWGGSMS